MAQGGTTDDKPMEMIAAPLDVGAALLGLFAVCAGIHARLRDGMGQRVWTSLAHASIFMQMSELVIRPGHDETGGPQSPLNSFVPTIDGWLRLQASDYAKEVSDLLLGMGQLNLETPDPDALYRALSAVVAPISRQQAEDLLAKAGIPSTATRSYQELILDDELVRDEVFHRFVRPDGREAFHVGRVARFSRTPRRGVVFTPRLGESTISLLTEVGKTLSDIERLRDAGVIRTE
jgi:crotonobetainyl-CoA:carnitine CoA-transferase CaiB-like acyl-CoA transferase